MTTTNLTLRLGRSVVRHKVDVSVPATDVADDVLNYLTDLLDDEGVPADECVITDLASTVALGLLAGRDADVWVGEYL